MLLRHSALYVFARGVPALVGFATIIVYTRLLSPEAYGQYTLVVTGALLVNVVLYQWLSASLLRFLPRSRDNEAGLLTAILGGFIFMSFLAGAGGALLAVIWNDTKWNTLILIGVLLVWVQAWFTINLELVRSRLIPARYGLISMLKAVISLGLGVTLILFGFSAYGALFGLIIGLFMAGLYSAWGQWVPFSKWHFNRDLIKKLLDYGLPLTASFALAVIIYSTDRFMLAAMIDESATGLYAAGQGLAQQTVGMLMTMVNLAAYPLILRTLEDVGPDAARTQLAKNAILLFGVGLPVAAIFILCSSTIANIFLGNEFKSAGIELMPWFALAAFLSGLRSYYYDLPFYLGEKTRIQVLNMVAAALLNILLNLWMIPVFGLLGAAFASVSALGLATVIAVILGKRAFRLPVMHADIVKLFLSVLIMAFVLFILPRSDDVLMFLLSLLLSGIAYVSSVLLFNVSGVRELTVRAFIKK